MVVAVTQATGCAWLVRRASLMGQTGDERHGITFYVGGAGPVGHVGSIDVPRGLQEAGYSGLVEVFTWQGVSHARDQIDLHNNRLSAADLASRIRAYMRRYPGRSVNLIALSAGTGITTFALEYLPEKYHVDNVVFLGCSLSADYDLTRALKRIGGRLYVVHSPEDRILKNVVWYSGTVDRASAMEGVAGLVGFRLPRHVGPDSKTQYEKLRNIPYRSEFAKTGYEGGHIDSTSRAFIREYVAGVIMDTKRRRLDGVDSWAERPPYSKSASASTRPSKSGSLGELH